MSSHTGNLKKRRRNDVCACGDIYCNHIMNFLGHVINKKCHYQRPSLCDGKTSHKKLIRNQKIDDRIKMWRSLQNSRFPENRISVTPSKSVRFNEIHFPIQFLKEQKRKKTCRIPMGMTVELSKKLNMFSDDSLYDDNNKNTTVLTIPPLNSWESIQVHCHIDNLNIDVTSDIPDLIVNVCCHT